MIVFMNQLSKMSFQWFHEKIQDQFPLFLQLLKKGSALYSYALEVRYIWRDKEYLFTFSFAKSADVRLLKQQNFVMSWQKRHFTRKIRQFIKKLQKFMVMWSALYFYVWQKSKRHRHGGRSQVGHAAIQAQIEFR